MYQACIFDLDGTLTDTLESITYSVNTTLRQMGFSTITKEQCKGFVGFGAGVLIQKSLKAVSGSDERYEEAMQIYKCIFQEYCTYLVTPYEGISQMLAELRKHGIRLAVLSNKPHAQTQKVVEEILGCDVFDIVCGQKEGVPRKPDPTAALQIATELQLRTEDCVYIGDSDVDMQTGKAAGMKTVGVTWGFRSRDVLRKFGADELLEHPLDLLNML